MKKLFDSSYFCIIIGVLALIIILFKTAIIRYNSTYKNGNQLVTGKVSNVMSKEYGISFIINTKEKIKCNYSDKIELNDGDLVQVNIDINDPSNNTIPNTFNYKKYLYNNKIYKIGKVNNIKAIKKNTNIFLVVRSYIKKYVSFNSYLKLFVLGDKSGISENYENYKNIGVAHLLAISGMHIGILILLIKKLAFFLTKNKQGIIICIVLLFYAFIVSFTASVLRVVTTYILNYLNEIFEIKLSRYKILYYSMIILILINPFYIYNVGFIYSFLCSFSLVLISKYLKKNYFLNLIIITFYLTLFTLPVTVNLNYEINILLILANFILIPFVSYVLFPFALIVLIFPFLNNIFNYFTIFMEKVAYLINYVSFTKITIPKLNIIYIIIYYIILLLFVIYNKKRYACYILILITIIKIIPFLDNNFYVYYLDVNQGDSILLISQNQKNITLIDTGGVYGKNISDNTITFLKSRGIHKINNIVITHGDFDHMGDAYNLVNNFKVKNVFFNCGPYNELEKKLISNLNNKKINYFSCLKSLKINKYDLVFLQTKTFDNENDNSNVIYININKYKFLFMGDAGVKKENEIIKNYNIQNIDFLKVGHHGSSTSSSSKFINTIKPKYSVISVGKNNRYGHPKNAVLNILKNSKIYRTDLDGSIEVKINRISYKIKKYNQ